MPESVQRIIYPELPQTPTADDLHRLFRPSYVETAWAGQIARSPHLQVVLLAQLKVFQTIGRFCSLETVPPSILSYIAQRANCPWQPGDQVVPIRTVYRQRLVIMRRLDIVRWGDTARATARQAMEQAAAARNDPAQIINAAIDALYRGRCELPALATLRKLGGTVARHSNATQWTSVARRLSHADRMRLNQLLRVNPETKKSAFARLCAAPRHASRKNLDELIEHHVWLQQLPDPAPALEGIADAKILLWANEAKRLNVQELAQYIRPRRDALLLALLRSARGQVLDELVQMLFKLTRRIENKSRERLLLWHQGRHQTTDTLIRVLRDTLAIHSSDQASASAKLAAIEQVLERHGGSSRLTQECDAHLRHEHQNWRPFALGLFAPLRQVLLGLVNILPLRADPHRQPLVQLVQQLAACTEGDAPDPWPEHPFGVLSKEWQRKGSTATTETSIAQRRRWVELASVLELATAIQAGEVFVVGSLSHESFWERLPKSVVAPEVLTAYALSRGWGEDARGFARSVHAALDRRAWLLDASVGSGERAHLRRGPHGRPVVERLRRRPVPETAVALEQALSAQMPERTVLEAIANTQHWTHWSRHFGPPSRLSAQIKDAAQRYVVTAFAYGCGLGPTEAARHFGGTVSADQLAFVDRRHVDLADLRAASADLIDFYAQFELPQQWGDRHAAAADGTHFESHEDNLLAEQHIRYGKTGGIAYRHVGDNYIALFSRFIACGTYEATHILDAMFQGLSSTTTHRVHADTHGQSSAVFGLAYLLGIELMPRIRRWHHLRLRRPDVNAKYWRIDHLFSAAVNWKLIEDHHAQFMQLAVAIQAGVLAPSAVLAQVNSYSTRNRFAAALKELGEAVRTTYLLEWVSDESLRRTVHRATTKVERHHKFAKHLAFGAGGHLFSPNPADQEKAVVYNELVANAVTVQNVVDQTQALHALQAKGVPIHARDLAFLSPYTTQHLKRFGEYAIDPNPQEMPATKSLPSL